MARTKKQYEQKAITHSIRFTSRASIKIGESFYTMEACEERIIPDIDGVDVEKEKKLLWDELNAQVDDQIEDIKRVYGIK